MSGAARAELEELYRTRYRAFLRVGTAITGDEAIAADAVHEGFVRAFRHRRRFRADGSLEGWVWRIVVNEARKQRDRERRERSVSNTVLLTTSRSSENGVHGHVRALLAALPERQRLVLFLRYYADLDYEAIAEALDIAPGTVGATLHAAHATLRKHLQEVPR